ncbi:MAG TPA: OB-fold domain-containing protein [Acidimicrobiales bacterium]|jgi:uncharacterized OB-fold protein|nr:OB-fold domain-containing protein [Acidimicrobiales bacterium]
MAATNDPEWLQPHGQALENGTFTVQRCDNCGYLRWPPARFCPTCLSDAAQWVEVSGRGRVWSFAVSQQSASEGDDGRYILVAVDLEEGPFLFGRLTGDPDDLKVGDQAHAHVAKIGDRPVLRFTKVSD